MEYSVTFYRIEAGSDRAKRLTKFLQTFLTPHIGPIEASQMSFNFELTTPTVMMEDQEAEVECALISAALLEEGPTLEALSTAVRDVCFFAEAGELEMTPGWYNGDETTVLP